MFWLKWGNGSWLKINSDTGTVHAFASFGSSSRLRQSGDDKVTFDIPTYPHLIKDAVCLATSFAALDCGNL